jgi:hypothetical protein
LRRHKIAFYVVNAGLDLTFGKDRQMRYVPTFRRDSFALPIRFTLCAATASNS